MSPSRSRSSTSLAAALGLVVAALAACGDDACGPGGAAATLVASGTGVSVTFSGLTGGLNNDCPEIPTVTALSIHGTQTGTTQPLTFCIPRPDKLAAGRSVGGNVDGVEFKLIDTSGEGGGCTFVIDRALPITGTASATGLCGNGKDSAGFALTIDATFSLKRTCGPTIDSVPVTMNGHVAVAAQK